MASIFDEIDAAAQAVFTSEMGEVMVFYPMRVSDYSEGVDPDRDEQETTGIYSSSPGTGGASEGLDGSSKTSSTRSHFNDEIWLDANEAALLTWRPRRDDEVVVNPNGENIRLTISAVYKNDNGDLQILANRRK